MLGGTIQVCQTDIGSTVAQSDETGDNDNDTRTVNPTNILKIHHKMLRTRGDQFLETISNFLCLRAAWYFTDKMENFHVTDCFSYVLAACARNDIFEACTR